MLLLANEELKDEAAVEAAKEAKAAIDLTKLEDADKAALQTKIDAADKKVAEAEVALTVPAVKSVNAINATQVELTFNKSVDAKSLFTDGVSGGFKSGVVSIRSIDSVTDGTLTGELSQDGKVLTVTSTQQFEKRYDVVVDKVKTSSGSDVEKFSKIISLLKKM